MGVIRLEGMEFHAFHGVYKIEKERGNKFVVDIDITYPFEDHPLNDNINNTINYENVFLIAKEVMEVPANLIEQVSLTIAKRVKGSFPKIQEVRVKVSKFNPPIEGNAQCASVEVVL